MTSLKAKVNLAIDAAIGLAFVVEAVSGFVLWLALPRGGFQGGRNANYGGVVVFDRTTWLGLHDWFAVIMVAGVLAHIVLHRRWIACMVRNLWREATTTQTLAPRKTEECPL